MKSKKKIFRKIILQKGKSNLFYQLGYYCDDYKKTNIHDPENLDQLMHDIAHIEIQIEILRQTFSDKYEQIKNSLIKTLENGQYNRNEKMYSPGYRKSGIHKKKSDKKQRQQ